MVELDPPVVADSDLVIDYLRGAAPGAAAVRRWLREGRLRVTAVTAFDLRIGADFLQRRLAIDALLARRTLPLDAVAAVRAGEVYSRLRGEGQEIGVKDCLVAGVCLRFGMALATRNVRHFGRIGELSLEPVTA